MAYPGKMNWQNNDIVEASDMNRIEQGVTNNDTGLTNHKNNTSNPHQTTKAHLGLGNVDNTSDKNKPVSTAQQTALDLKADKTELIDLRLIVQPTLPTNAMDWQLWLDTSTQPAVLRRREGNDWTAVTDLTQIENILAGKMGEEDVRDMLEALELSLTTTMQSTIDQTESDISLRISQVTAAMDAYGQELNSLGDHMDMVWRITPEGAEFGTNDNPIKLAQKPDRISFIENGREIAYFSNWQLYVTSIHIASDGILQHGDLTWGYSSSGNYELRQVGV